MQIKQFEDKNLSHFSYAIVSESAKALILIDPARNPKPYLDFAKQNDSEIIGIIETHPHADFVSSHLEMHTITGAPIYTSKISNAIYPHLTFDEGQFIEMDNIKLSAMNTPGHSPDSISILMEEAGVQKAVFTGDTLFIGDCGRPDLREDENDMSTSREVLARHMYHSLRNKLMNLDDDVVIFPAHGAGSLCGKNVGSENSSTMGEQKKTNWCLQPQSEDEFVKNLLDDQPFIPAYFPFDVKINKKGAASFTGSMEEVFSGYSLKGTDELDRNLWVVDGRKESHFKQGHLPHAVNIMEDGKFETWLGSIIKPQEPFYLAGETEKQVQQLFERAASIGYEAQVRDFFVVKEGPVIVSALDMETFKNNPDDFTIVDVRNTSEVKQEKIFAGSISIPLPELRERVNEIPTGKPIVVHCAGGYRSAAGSSLIQSGLNSNAKVFDLGENVKEFIKN